MQTKTTPLLPIFNLLGFLLVIVMNYLATSLPLAMTMEMAIMVFVGTLLACFLSGAIATRRLVSADPADLF